MLDRRPPQSHGDGISENDQRKVHESRQQPLLETDPYVVAECPARHARDGLGEHGAEVCAEQNPQNDERRKTEYSARRHRAKDVVEHNQPFGWRFCQIMEGEDEQFQHQQQSERGQCAGQCWTLARMPFGKVTKPFDDRRGSGGQNDSQDGQPPYLEAFLDHDEQGKTGHRTPGAGEGAEPATFGPCAVRSANLAHLPFEEFSLGIRRRFGHGRPPTSARQVAADCPVLAPPARSPAAADTTPFRP